MSWKVINTTEELQALDRKVCWEGGEISEAYRVSSAQSYFPDDINRSGYNLPNLHLLIATGLGIEEWLEVVLLETTAKTISNFSGYVSPLKIAQFGHDSASQVIYRWVKSNGSHKPRCFVENWGA
ncbi:hypothetical protein N474_25345 [Pseudoalteromonas luteoviolacea CPMOR-2]|uniref:hypothetical protein n=1 Tax=Pseudoalteromonas luteoviolacea TaxID=43657 RepID=UPI0007B078DB|nr:hypothetical protein [Pseudoalteromonas luteoviolacea]KZN59522.1 hypothetical protein N474_25345 [Pseudoalteromonas luteoviolacea CPMOR-2]